MKATFSALLMTTTLLVAFGPQGTSGATATAKATAVDQPATSRVQTISPRRRVLMLTNDRREAHGCNPVRWNDQLALAAQRHTRRMADANTMSHQLPGEPDPGRRIRNAGYDWTAWGENVAAGQPTAYAVMRAWMHSPGHRANILNCSFEHLGVGYAKSANGTPYWTQDFGRN